MFLSRDKKGFTLIELLVVISIISLLSSIVLASLNTARIKARDAKRMQDLRQIRTALELYYDDNGKYPVISGWVYSTNWGALQTALTPYMKKMPVDPKNTGLGPWNEDSGYTYAYGNNTASYPNEYDLVAQFEDHSNPNRCELKGWIENTVGNDRPWCRGSHGKPNPQNYSPYLYTDH
ncbi:MAG: prepilin-type N-terminal cleavage/methylation domain-containing protein [Candidatus Paceibacterota bacterium]